MHIAVGMIVVAALALLFLLIPALALQALLRAVAPPSARLPAGTDERADYVPIEEVPTRPLELLRTES